MSPFQILHIIKQQAQYEHYQNYRYFDLTYMSAFQILDENAIIDIKIDFSSHLESQALPFMLNLRLCLSC
jgi:hypothetical protein